MPKSAEVVAWTAELDRLEASTLGVERIVRERIAGAAPSPWTVPDLPGPLPPALRDRARRLVARQEAARTALAELVDRARRRAAYDRPAVAPGAVYLDIDA